MFHSKNNRRRFSNAQSMSTETPNGARRAMLLIGGILVAGLLAMHFLAPAPVIETAKVPATVTR
jgi:hypothetical protein